MVQVGSDLKAPPVPTQTRPGFHDSTMHQHHWCPPHHPGLLEGLPSLCQAVTAAQGASLLPSRKHQPRKPQQLPGCKRAASPRGHRLQRGKKPLSLGPRDLRCCPSPAKAPPWGGGEFIGVFCWGKRSSAGSEASAGDNTSMAMSEALAWQRSPRALRCCPQTPPARGPSWALSISTIPRQLQPLLTHVLSEAEPSWPCPSRTHGSEGTTEGCL